MNRIFNFLLKHETINTLSTSIRIISLGFGGYGIFLGVRAHSTTAEALTRAAEALTRAAAGTQSGAKALQDLADAHKVK